MKFCLDCSEKLNDNVKICPKCGFNYDKFMGKGTGTITAKAQKKRKGLFPIFSEEECLVYGIHPNDEMYRKTMEMNVLSKNYK